MKSGFSFELYEMVFKNCFIHSSNYKNGNLQLSLFGVDPELNETAHFADITLDQNRKVLKENEIVVDCKYKPTLIPQLKNLGILKEQTGICVENSSIYPIYTIDFSKTQTNQYCMQELVAA
jgi:hypothetical protein